MFFFFIILLLIVPERHPAPQKGLNCLKTLFRLPKPENPEGESPDGRAQQLTTQKPWFSRAIFLSFERFFGHQIWLPMALLPVNIIFTFIFHWKIMKSLLSAFSYWKFAENDHRDHFCFQIIQKMFKTGRFSKILLMSMADHNLVKFISIM